MRQQAFHRQLLTNAINPLRLEIERITGVEVGEAPAEGETATEAVAWHGDAADDRVETGVAPMHVDRPAIEIKAPSKRWRPAFGTIF